LRVHTKSQIAIATSHCPIIIPLVANHINSPIRFATCSHHDVSNNYAKECMRCLSLNLSFFLFGNSHFNSQHAWDEAIITIVTLSPPPPSRFEVVIRNNQIILNEVPPLLSLPSHFINC